jgi:GrpB-like predicted nucleotidyltransferase (UPF0157 family)
MESENVEFVDESGIRAPVAQVFESLGKTLASILPRARIEHVGSTSIPGAITKGDLDICVLVEGSAFPDADRSLAERFARNLGSDRTATFSSFSDSSWPVAVGIQLVVLGGEEDVFVPWRDLLRASPELLKRYDELKRLWHGRSHEEYRAAKAKFIEEALGAAARNREDH